MIRRTALACVFLPAFTTCSSQADSTQANLTAGGMAARGGQAAGGAPAPAKGGTGGSADVSPAANGGSAGNAAGSPPTAGGQPTAGSGGLPPSGGEPAVGGNAPAGSGGLGPGGGNAGTGGSTAGTGGSLARTGGSPASTDGDPRLSRPRVIHTTDLGADPDDQESMVRQFVMANEFDIEGLIVSTGCWKKSQSSTQMLDALNDAYGKAVSNLKAHDPNFPSVEHLRSVSMMGQKGYGMSDVGDGKDSPGSDLIVAAVDKNDPRPVWATCWGGCNTIAQAIWKVQKERSPAELSQFISKLHVYDILGQDDAGAWMAKTFPQLLFIRATSVYNWQPSKAWVNSNVRDHGDLGKAYPEKAWSYEGDSPAIFHLIPNGLHDPAKVDQGGWGGRFPSKKANIRGMNPVKKANEEAKYDTYMMYNDDPNSIKKWSAARQNDFAARMDWSVSSNYADANHHPVAVVNGDRTRNVLEVSAAGGSEVALSAAGSADPDKDPLAYKWWFWNEPSSYGGSLSIEGDRAESAMVAVPAGATGKNIHIILELQDNGSPSLTVYRRVIINVN